MSHDISPPEPAAPVTPDARAHVSMQNLKAEVGLVNRRLGRVETTLNENKASLEMVKTIVKEIQEALKAGDFAEEGPDNYDKTPEQVRDLIIANYKLGVPFYPSDVADDHGLDYDTVVQAMDILRKEGRLKDGGP